MKIQKVVEKEVVPPHSTLANYLAIHSTHHYFERINSTHWGNVVEGGMGYVGVNPILLSLILITS